MDILLQYAEELLVTQSSSSSSSNISLMDEVEENTVCKISQLQYRWGSAIVMDSLNIMNHLQLHQIYLVFR